MPAYRFDPTTGEIRHARRYVGSVRRAENGRDFVGRIREHTFTASTMAAAFREVSALAMGFASAAALRQHNAGIRARNRARRASWDFRPSSPRPTARRPVEAIPDEPFSE